jgi:hypothetical protein
MTHYYEAAEIIEIGSAQDVILGSLKDLIFDDSPSELLRETIAEDDED